jgi:peptide/nickel transport system ATP-binding protein
MRLEAKDITFAYGNKRIVFEKVNLTVEPGERVALVGPSGCGKSTLSSILAGYYTPRSGEVTFGGEPLPRRGYNPVQLIYQHPEQAINPRWRLRRTLCEAWEPDDDLLREMGIEKAWLSRYPNELSGGEMQRFCIARALGPQTRFLIADEISTMLDVITQAQIWNVLMKLIEQRGLGLLAVTHSPELAARICDRVIQFDEVYQQNRIDGEK